MKYTRFFLAAVLVLAIIAIAGCGSAGQKYYSSEDDHIRQYVEAVLNNSYKNDNRLFVRLGIGTAKEAKEIYENGLQLEIEALSAVYNEEGSLVSAGKEETEKWRKAMAKALKSVRYSVNSAAPGENGAYIVSVSYEQAELFRLTLAEYTKRLDDLRAELEEKYTDVLAYNIAVMQIYRDCFEDALLHLTYKEKQIVYVTVEKDDDGVYHIDDKSLYSLESLFLDVDYANNYAYDENADPGVEVGKYKGIEVTRNEIKVSADDIEASIHMTLADLRTDTGRRTIELYDFVTMDYEVRLSGSSEILSAEEDYEIMVGSGSTVEGLEDKLIGHETGETLDFTLTYPEDHINSDVAGKEADFHIILKGIKAVPEITDDIVASNTEFEDYNELWNYVSDELYGMAEEENENRFRRAVLEEIIAGSTFDNTLGDEIEDCKNDVLNVYREQAAAYEMSFEEFVDAAFGMGLDDFYIMLEADSRFQVQVERVLFAIAKQEGLSVSDDEIEAFISSNIDAYGYADREAVIADYGMGYIKRLILQDKALSLVLGNAVIK